MEGLGFIGELPEGCISEIISLTSPEEACKSSAVSTSFRSAAESDLVWERFLPSDYRGIVARAVTPLSFSSKKELFLCLCNPILVDGSTKTFALDKLTGKKSIMFSARALSITWGNDPMYWSWRTVPESRFPEVAELRSVSWLEIQCKFATRMLTTNTRYVGYLVFQIAPRAYGLDAIPSEVCIEVGEEARNSMGTVRLGNSTDKQKMMMESFIFSNRMAMLRSRVEGGGDDDERRQPVGRGDGWLEVELGEFFSGECSQQVKMSLMEVKGQHLKGGLIVQGIEVRPKH